MSFSEKYCLDFAILIECEWHGYLFDKGLSETGAAGMSKMLLMWLA